MTENVQHRTDCADCGETIYHPSMDEVRAHPTGQFTFWGLRQEGRVYKHTDPDGLIHYIIESEDRTFVMATCCEYWKLHDSFKLLEKLIAGTKHNLSEAPF